MSDCAFFFFFFLFAGTCLCPGFVEIIEGNRKDSGVTAGSTSTISGHNTLRTLLCYLTVYPLIVDNCNISSSAKCPHVQINILVYVHIISSVWTESRFSSTSRSLIRWDPSSNKKNVLIPLKNLRRTCPLQIFMNESYSWTTVWSRPRL